jgi:hypothetical protein
MANQPIIATTPATRPSAPPLAPQSQLAAAAAPEPRHGNRDGPADEDQVRNGEYDPERGGQPVAVLDRRRDIDADRVLRAGIDRVCLAAHALLLCGSRKPWAWLQYIIECPPRAL